MCTVSITSAFVVSKFAIVSCSIDLFFSSVFFYFIGGQSRNVKINVNTVVTHWVKVNEIEQIKRYRI